jgi:hypothetical protein
MSTQSELPFLPCDEAAASQSREMHLNSTPLFPDSLFSLFFIPISLFSPFSLLSIISFHIIWHSGCSTRNTTRCRALTGEKRTAVLTSAYRALSACAFIRNVRLTQSHVKQLLPSPNECAASRSSEHTTNCTSSARNLATSSGKSCGDRRAHTHTVPPTAAANAATPTTRFAGPRGDAACRFGADRTRRSSARCRGRGHAIGTMSPAHGLPAARSSPL